MHLTGLRGFKLHLSSLSGNLFETMVFMEILKAYNNQGKVPEISFFRTKEGEEVDFLIQKSQDEYFVFESKLRYSGFDYKIPVTLEKILENKLRKTYIVSLTGGFFINENIEVISIFDIDHVVNSILKS